MPIVDTVAIFAAVDPLDRFHSDGVECLQKLGGASLLGASALVEFDVVLKSNGLSPKARREEMTLLMLEFPSTVTQVHRLTPQTLYLAALYEEEYGLGYFDAMIASEAREHDGTVVSTDRAFDAIPGLKRVWPAE